MGTLNDVRVLVDELMSKEFTFTTYSGTHSVSAKGLGYRFEFNNRKRAFGTCHYIQKKISLSLPLCSENLDKIDSRIQNTILHEMAHAFSVEVYGIPCLWVATILESKINKNGGATGCGTGGFVTGVI